MSASSVAGAARAAGRGASLHVRRAASRRNPLPTNASTIFNNDKDESLPRSAGRGSSGRNPALRQSAGRGSMLRRRPDHISSFGRRDSDSSKIDQSSTQASHLSQSARSAVVQSKIVRNGPRSALAEAVLGNRKARDTNSHRNERGSDSMRSGGEDSRSMSKSRNNRRKQSSDIFNDDGSSSESTAEIAAARARARQEWFEKSKAMTSTGSQDFSSGMNILGADQVQVNHNSDDDGLQPFAWGDLQLAVDQLPEEHWAAPYLGGVANSLQENASLSSQRKRIMMQQVTTALASVSKESNTSITDTSSASV